MPISIVLHYRQVRIDEDSGKLDTLDLLKILVSAAGMFKGC